MYCISRYTDDDYTQQFGNGRNKFYIEFRCNLPCVNGSDVCSKCANKNTTASQTSKKFNHGKINEPIPDTSHIYGGKWYNQAVKKYGEPSPDIIEFAVQYQKKAREGFTFEDEEETVAEVEVKVEAKKKETVKRSKETNASTNDAKKSRRKPKLAEETSVKPNSTKNTTAAYNAIINNTQQLVHKEVVLPTHIETNLEEFDTDGYEIEYIKLEPFEVNGTTYFRESNKNKLYRKNKEKGIGGYVGRWNPDTESIITEIPDSDDEE
jgi:hypothetical protein